MNDTKIAIPPVVGVGRVCHRSCLGEATIPHLLSKFLIRIVSATLKHKIAALANHKFMSFIIPINLSLVFLTFLVRF